jgi:hypothetical protein
VETGSLPSLLVGADLSNRLIPLADNPVTHPCDDLATVEILGRDGGERDLAERARRGIARPSVLSHRLG